MNEAIFLIAIALQLKSKSGDDGDQLIKLLTRDSLTAALRHARSVIRQYLELE